MSDNLPRLKSIIELSQINHEELRFLHCGDLWRGELLNELDRAKNMVLNGEFLGVKIKADN